MMERFAIVEGIRTPMAKAGGMLKEVPADDLGAYAVKELIQRTSIPLDEIDELIFGNVATPTNAANIARVIALKAGMPVGLPAFTVGRNCASGMESITTAVNKIRAGEGKVFIAGGTESMSNIPLLFNKEMTQFYERLSKSKTFGERLATVFGFRPHFLKPEIGVIQGLTDPICGMIMGETAEVLAREFHITRQEQDEYALMSHQRAIAAMKSCILSEEIVPVPLKPKYKAVMERDQGPRENQTLEALAKLRPFFDRYNGTVTVGNSCPITDGAAAVLVMSEEESKARGYKPLGYLIAYAYASLEPHRMGLGPTYATARLLDKTGMRMEEIDLVELNEAFAAQVIANQRAFPSAEFARRYLGRDKPVGELNRETLNVNGGAIAFGHPVGMTGTRLVIHLLKELRRRKKNIGLATLCVGGGQGAALLLEAA